MKMPDVALGPEWALLELVCLGGQTSQEKELFEWIVKSFNIHWGELLEQSLRHRILPLFAFHANNEFDNIFPNTLKNHLLKTLAVNRQTTTIQRRETARIVKALKTKEVQFVATKGITLESTIYNGNGSRYFSDLDFMTFVHSRDVVLEQMESLGYKIGAYFDWKTNIIFPFDKELLTVYKLNPDHLPRFMFLTDDPVVQTVAVDFATSLTWTRSPFNVDLKAALSEIVYQPLPGIPDVQLPCFTPKFQFIFTMLHLFREAWVFREGWTEKLLGWENDVRLGKFADVIRLWRAYQNDLNTPDFIQTLEEFHIIDPILWVLEHTDRTFDTGIVPALGLEGRVTEEWLHSAGGVGGKRVQWKGTMRERLHCKDRRQLFLTDT